MEKKEREIEVTSSAKDAKKIKKNEKSSRKKDIEKIKNKKKREILEDKEDNIKVKTKDKKVKDKILDCLYLNLYHLRERVSIVIQRFSISNKLTEFLLSKIPACVGIRQFYILWLIT